MQRACRVRNQKKGNELVALVGGEEKEFRGKKKARDIPGKRRQRMGGGWRLNREEKL